MNGRGGGRQSARAGFFLVVLLLGGMLVLAGCTLEMSLDTEVAADGSGSMGIRLAADEEMQQLLAQQSEGDGDIFAEFAEEMPEGWEAESGTDDDGTKWVRASREFSDLDELSGALDEAAGGEQLPAQELVIEQEQSFLRVTTSYRSVWDVGDMIEGTGEQLPEGFGPDALAGIIQVQNRATLPGTIEEHNADEVEGNTLTWTPGFDGTAEMEATSTAYRWDSLLGLLIAAIIVVAATVVVIVMVAARRGERESDALAAAGTGDSDSSDTGDSTGSGDADGDADGDGD